MGLDGKFQLQNCARRLDNTCFSKFVLLQSFAQMDGAIWQGADMDFRVRLFLNGFNTHSICESKMCEIRPGS